MCLCFRVSWTVTRLCSAALIGWMGWLRDLRSHDGLSIMAEQSVHCFCSHKIKNKLKKCLCYLLPCTDKTLEPQEKLVFNCLFFLHFSVYDQEPKQTFGLRCGSGAGRGHQASCFLPRDWLDTLGAEEDQTTLQTSHREFAPIHPVYAEDAAKTITLLLLC